MLIRTRYDPNRNPGLSWVAWIDERADLTGTGYTEGAAVTELVETVSESTLKLRSDLRRSLEAA